MSALDAAFAAIPADGRAAIANYALTRPRCMAAQVGLALSRGVSGDDVVSVIAAMAPGLRVHLAADARRQEANAFHRGAGSRARFYGVLAALTEFESTIKEHA